MFFLIWKTFDILSTSGWLTLLLATIFGLLSLLYLLTRHRNLPPGPIGLPIIGYLPFLTKTPHQKLNRLAEKYGDVMSFNVMGMNFIHLNTVDAIREAFVTQGNEFAGRAELLPVAQQLFGNLGIVPSDGETWQIHRRFALHTLRDFGFGKHSLEERIQEIAKDILKDMEESKGKPFDIKRSLVTATANVICSLLFDKHFEANDPLLHTFIRSIESLVNDIPPMQTFLNGPLVRLLPLQYLPAAKAVINANKAFQEVVTNIIKEHQDTFDPTFLRDYVDVYLAEAEKDNASGDAENSTFTIDRLKAVSFDLFAAGTETTSNTIHWALFILMFRPEMQRKIHSEIDEVIGRERFPSIKDRPRMPYTEATINEVLRFSSLVPLGLYHANPEEAKFRNYVIPKRSTIVPNLWAIHNDPKYWTDPEKFDPTRFLGPNGELEKRDSFFPFSIGKRFCLGETLARMELFIFLTAILQRFTITPLDSNTKESFRVQLGIIRSLHPYKLCARKR